MADHNPLQEFHKLFCEAQENNDGQEINAMLLTTVGKDDFPRSRMVLLKKYDWDGFIFFTNYNSKKGKDIALNSNVHLLFRWNAIKTEIHIQGKAEKVPKHISQNYFDLRPRESKLGTHASQQSKVIASRTILEEQFRKVEIDYENKEIPKPKHWGGYLVKPTTIEFKFYQDDLVENQTYSLTENFEWSLKTTYTINEI